MYARLGRFILISGASESCSGYRGGGWLPHLRTASFLLQMEIKGNQWIQTFTLGFGAPQRYLRRKFTLSLIITMRKIFTEMSSCDFELICSILWRRGKEGLFLKGRRGYKHYCFRTLCKIMLSLWLIVYLIISFHLFHLSDV